MTFSYSDDDTLLFYEEAGILKESIWQELIRRYKDMSIDSINQSKQKDYLNYTWAKIIDMLYKVAIDKGEKPNDIRDFKDRIKINILTQKKVERFKKYLSKQDTRDLIEAYYRIQRYDPKIHHLNERKNQYFIDINKDILAPYFDNYKNFVYKLKPQLQASIEEEKEEEKGG